MIQEFIKPSYDLRLWDDSNSWFEAPTIREITDIALTTISTLTTGGIANGLLNLTDDLFFSLLDYSGNYKRNDNVYYGNNHISLTQTNSPIKQNELLSPNRYSSFEGFVQPRMRFKPRTDLERIFDSLNESPFYRKLDKDILQRHLAKLSNTQTVKIKNKNKVEEKDDNLSEIADKDLNENDPYHQIYKHYIKEKKHKKK